MRPFLAPLLMGLSVIGSAQAQSYFSDADLGIARPMADTGLDRHYVVGDGQAGAAPGGGTPAGATAATSGPRGAGTRQAIRELEGGMRDLKEYSVEMATHLQQNGLEGFIDVPDALTQKGSAIGGRLGRSIQAVGRDVQTEMIRPR